MDKEKTVSKQICEPHKKKKKKVNQCPTRKTNEWQKLL